MKYINIQGEKFGKLTAIEVHSKSRNGHERWVCECECGNTAHVLKTHLRQGNTKSCGCLIERTGKDHPSWKGHGDISAKFWHHNIVRSANGEKGRKEIPLEVTIENVWDLFLQQDRKCALSGIKLRFPRTSGNNEWTASLDRIDSSKGYTKNNIQWVHKDINVMKNKYNNEYFIQTCKRIAQNT